MDKATVKKYNYWQWRTLIILIIGYALFYFVRKNFSIAMPALEAELGLSKTQLGIFLTLNGVIYGVSRFVNGMLADRFSRKRMMDDMSMNFMSKTAPDFMSKGNEVFDKILNDELTVHLDEEAASHLCCQLPLPADYDGEGDRGTKFILYL